MATTQEKWFAFQANRNLNRSGGASSSFSDAAQAVIDKLTNPTTLQQTSIATYIDAETANGNQALKDYELIFSLGSVNGLIDLVGTKVATNNNGTFDINGITLNGTTAFVQSDYNPTVDATNYALNDMNVGCFVKVNNDQANNANLFHAVGACQIFQNPASTRYRYQANSATTNAAVETFFDDNSLYMLARDAVNSSDINKDGSSIFSSAAVSTSIPDAELKVGSATGANFFNGTISTFMIGGAVGFNQAAYNTNLRALLTSLGLTL